ncbi:MAG: L-2-amino-thiazoline-4-carboxylic acid hydrolase [Deltaproteobacteria bacterium]|nr:L-2-amino-thiazoline-4-carboxylic acid hydrolase [Deltaproteobacteria bacterium]MBW2334488.1 L-2-amino-thiazoline-4-carboxylic acid hydrolase [Deltaproteobacteria bacterium]
MATYEAQVKQREGELDLAVYFAKALIGEVGKERALEILKKGWSESWLSGLNKAIGEVPTAERFTAFRKWMMDRSASNQWLEVLEASPKRVAIKITKCTTYDACKNKGALEVCQAYCESDYLSAPMIHPHVKLIRDKELANGADYCNHVWVLEE